MSEAKKVQVQPLLTRRYYTGYGLLFLRREQREWAQLYLRDSGTLIWPISAP